MKEIKFSEILKNLRKINKHTQEDLANLLEVRKTTVSNYETGYSTPDSKMLIKISQLYNISVSELLGQVFVGAKQPSIVQENNYLMNKLSIKILVVDDLADIENENTVLFCITIPIDKNEEGKFIGVKIKGEILTKSRINDGDIAIIKLQDKVENGDIAIVCVNEKDYIIGKFYKNDENLIMLVPDCFSEKYSPYIINLNNDKYRVIGKVVNAIINL